MPLIVFHTRRVREVLKQPQTWGADILFLALLAATVGALVMMGRQAGARYARKVEISLSLAALPKYTLLSLSRGFAAYALSLAFTLVYGTIAAHNRRAERFMMPAIDVLQSIPVLSFLPGIVLAMIHLFPTRQLGLEIACVVMIFTGQVWNMTFSFYGSIRAIPTPLVEAAQVYRMSRWRMFRLLELPASMIGLVWNSMMSMAGGWFFLMTTEAFQLGDKDFRLPGIGSYMSEAMDQFNAHDWATWRPVLGAMVAMVLMIVIVDQVFWRPIVAWSERFKLEETAEVDKPQSWVLSLLQHSRLYHWLSAMNRRLRQPLPAAAPALAYAGVAVSSGDAVGKDHHGAAPHSALRRRAVTDGRREGKWRRPVKAAIKWLGLAALACGAGWGMWCLIRLLAAVPLRDPATAQDWLHVLLALGASFLRTSASVLVGAAWTLPAGILIGLSPALSQRLQPLVQVVASFPAPMLFPLVTLALLTIHVPFTVTSGVLMLMGAQWYILFNVIAGAMAIPGDLKEVGRVFRTSRFKQWARLYVPCVFPYFATGLITATGGAWNATIVAEYVQVKRDAPAFVSFGLGSMLNQATSSGNYSLLAAGTVTMALTVVLLNRAFWKRLYRLAEQRYSLNV